MDLDSKDFHFLADIIKRYSGISLEEDKGYLLQGRLLPVAEKYGLSSLKELVQYTQQNNNESFLIEIIEAMTTNESFFYRDEKVFSFLVDKAIPQIMSENKDKKTIKIWSAACSTGQEPYSAAISIIEKLGDINFEILATDLDFNVIEKAKEGLYTQFEVQRGMPINYLVKYFSQEGDQWRIKSSVKSKVKFEKFNLMDSPNKFGKFDIIFCRNVLIYFESETKINVVKRLSECMEGHSKLFLGATESIVGKDAGLNSVKLDGNIQISGVFTL